MMELWAANQAGREASSAHAESNHPSKADARRQIQQLHRKWIADGNAAGAFLEACAEYCNDIDVRLNDEREG